MPGTQKYEGAYFYWPASVLMKNVSAANRKTVVQLKFQNQSEWLNSPARNTLAYSKVNLCPNEPSVFFRVIFYRSPDLENLASGSKNGGFS